MSEDELRQLFFRIDDVLCGLRDTLIAAVDQDAFGSINKTIGDVKGTAQWPYPYTGKVDLYLEIKAEIPRKEES